MNIQKLHIDMLQNEMKTDNSTASQSFSEMKVSHLQYSTASTNRGRSYTAPNRGAYQSSINSHNAKMLIYTSTSPFFHQQNILKYVHFIIVLLGQIC